ncbi:MAG: molybdenum cofactor guanylyltransferase [Bdellovibrio sp.]|nr:molybdenum cofactor guanylyltransferase [Bdellovibrio sp.]
MVNNNFSVFGIVLAGGKSTRMGLDKRFLAFREKLLIEHAIDLLKHTLGENALIYISGKCDGFAYIDDEISGLGPIGGIYSVMNCLRKEWISKRSFLLFIPVDMPLLTKDVLQNIVFDSNKDVICFDHYELPIYLRADERVFDVLTKIYNSKNHHYCSIKELLRHLNILRIKTSPLFQSSFVNANTPQEFAHMCEFV